MFTQCFQVYMGVYYQSQRSRSVKALSSRRQQQKRQGEAHLRRLIDLCKSVEERGLDPFLVDVEDVINIVH